MTTQTIQPQVTLAQVAAHSGVSTSSVSKVMNLSPDKYRMSEQTRQRVLKAIEELGYRPNFRARSLAKGRTHTIGVIYRGAMPSILREDQNGVSLVSSMQNELTKHEFQMVFIPVIAQDDSWIRMLSDRRVDGCLIVNGIDPQIMDVINQLNMPAVLVNGESEFSIPVCNVENVSIAKTLTAHLLDLGHQDIWMYTNIYVHAHYSVDQREQGYEQAMTEAGLGAKVQKIRMDMDQFVESVIQSTSRPTAIVVYQHLEAVRLLQAFWRVGIQVPKDVSVVTFNDAYPTQYVIPPLTTMALPISTLGQEAARMLVELIESKGEKSVSSQAFSQTQLVVRESATSVKN